MKQITTSNQIIDEQQQESRKDRREGKGRVLAISRRMYRLLNSDTFYVKSESSDGIYYFVKFTLQYLSGVLVRIMNQTTKEKDSKSVNTFSQLNLLLDSILLKT